MCWIFSSALFLVSSESSLWGHKLPSIDVIPIPHLHYEVTDPATVVEIIGDIQKEIGTLGKPPMQLEASILFSEAMRQSENALISHLRTIDAECTISPLPLPPRDILLLLV